MKSTRRVRYYKGYMTDPFNVTSLLVRNITHNYLKNNFTVHKTDRFCVCLTVVRFFAPHSWWGPSPFPCRKMQEECLLIDRISKDARTEKSQTFCSFQNNLIELSSACECICKIIFFNRLVQYCFLSKDKRAMY